jgi:hypothetical protein
MSFIACSGAVTIDANNTPACATGWLIIPDQAVNPQGLTAQDYSELQSAVFLFLMLGFSIKIIRKLFFK